MVLILPYSLIKRHPVSRKNQEVVQKSQNVCPKPTLRTFEVTMIELDVTLYRIGVARDDANRNLGA
jgi:hypothetical protein